MKNILLIVAIVLFPAFIQENPNIIWKDYIKINNITIKSTLTLKKWKVEKIQSIYNKSKDLFFNEFENIKCNENIKGELNIGIISAVILRDNKYFKNASPVNFGRYFSETNDLYIIHDFFKHPEYLAHELAHHFYDECNIKELNHNKVYEFQYFYKSKI